MTNAKQVTIAKIKMNYKEGGRSLVLSTGSSLPINGGKIAAQVMDIQGES